MEKHGNVSIDFSNYGGKIVNMRVPFHQTCRELINDLVEIHNYESLQDKLQLQSFKALIGKKFISGRESLIDANIKDGEILVIIK
jgi:uncharacterized ubiquitin-like protein YukD